MPATPFLPQNYCTGFSTPFQHMLQSSKSKEGSHLGWVIMPSGSAMDTFKAWTKISLGDHCAKYMACFELYTSFLCSGAGQGQFVSLAFCLGFECVHGWSPA